MKHIDLKLPESWKDLTLHHLKHVAEIMLLKGIDRMTLQTMLFCMFTGVRLVTHSPRRWGVYELAAMSRRGTPFRISDENLLQFVKKLDYIFDESPADIVNPTKINSHLMGIRFDNYYLADTAMLRYQVEGDASWVTEAMKQLGSDETEPTSVEAMMIWLWWSGVKGYLKELYPLVFRSGDPDGGEPQNCYFTLLDILQMLNDNRPHDNRKILASGAHDVLVALNSKIERMEAMKEAMKK